MTLEDVKAMPAEMLTTDTVGKILGMDPSRVAFYAERGDFKGMFPCLKSGNRWKFPKAAFVRWMEGGNANG